MKGRTGKNNKGRKTTKGDSRTTAPASHGQGHDEEPLLFFTGQQDKAPAFSRKVLILAGVAGLAAGLTAVGLYAALNGAQGPSGPQTAAMPEKEMLWQRPVISAKSDLSGEIAQQAQQPAKATSELPPPQQLPEAAGIPLMTTFARQSGMDTTGRAAGVLPSILQASLIVPQDTGGNEIVITKSPPPEPVDTGFVLGKGETIADKLVELGVSPAAAKALVRALEPVYPSRLLRAGQKFSVTLDRQQDFYGSEVIYPVYLSFSPRKGESVTVESDEEGNFLATSKGLKQAASKKPAGKKAGKQAGAGKDGFIHVRARVTSSLYATARDQHIPAYIISQMLRAFSYDLDLQRQVAKGDVFEVLYGPPLSGSSRRRKVLYYASIKLRTGKKVYYRFTTPRGRTAYFDPRGRSAIKGLMRTPVSGARITSGFGMRRHPILGYSKMHTGVDFGAPRGTPIHAAGNGVVTYAAWRGGYGRAVMIRHDNGYTTLYAHQSRIARGIRKGVRVRQGQVIGYVGSTGRSTGPHLHFEVRINNRPVNPLRVRTTTRIRLKGKAMQLFKKRMARINALLRNAPAQALVARN